MQSSVPLRLDGHPSRVMIAGLAVAGAGLFAMNAPTSTGPMVQHLDVKLASGEVDWSTFLVRHPGEPGDAGSRRRHGEHRAVDCARQRVGAFRHSNQHRSDRLRDRYRELAVTVAGTAATTAMSSGCSAVTGCRTRPAPPRPAASSLLCPTTLPQLDEPQCSEQLFSDFNAYSLETAGPHPEAAAEPPRSTKPARVSRRCRSRSSCRRSRQTCLRRSATTASSRRSRRPCCPPRSAAASR